MKLWGAIALAATLLITAACDLWEEPEITELDAWTMMVNSVVEMQANGKTMCTATQIGPTAYLSAGHCFVIGNATHIRKNNETRDIVFHHYEFEPGVDWAVFYTNEPMPTTSSLPLACKESTYVSQRIATIGHPGPFLYDFNVGRITGYDLYPRQTRKPGSDFFADNMIGGGASGSSVISMDTGGIIGIVVEAFFNNMRTSFRMGVQEIEPVCRYLDRTAIAYEEK